LCRVWRGAKSPTLESGADGSSKHLNDGSNEAEMARREAFLRDDVRSIGFFELISL
jgi:hypothetical protein